MSLSFYLSVNSLGQESMTAGVWCYVVILSPPNVWIWLRCSRSQGEHMAPLFSSFSYFWTLSYVLFYNVLDFACEQGTTMKIFFIFFTFGPVLQIFIYHWLGHNISCIFLYVYICMCILLYVKFNFLISHFYYISKKQ